MELQITAVIPICCVSIGMIKDMKPLFGVIYDFNSDEIYCGDCINKVATLNNSPIQVSKVDDKKDGVLITGYSLTLIIQTHL